MDDDATTGPEAAHTELGIDDLTDAVEVGAGGFGTVYRARQVSLRRDVAVKMVTSTVKDRKVRIRFEREIQAMGMLSGHPNIVTVYDSGFTAKGQPYILMDFMDGGSLGDRLDDVKTMGAPEVLAIMVKVCGALETAHQAGILHRDLKPENILVSAYDEPKLGDFGIARLKGGPETGTASLTASIEHVAPELLEAAKPSVASDLYALGSTMYKMLVGRAAFLMPGDESIVPALTRIRNDPVPDMRSKGVPPVVADIVERAMAKKPEQRFGSSAEMGRACQQAQRSLGQMPTSLPIREADAAAVRESTRTINSDELSRSVDQVLRAPAAGGQQGLVPGPGGLTAPPPPGVRPGAPAAPAAPQGFSGGFAPTPQQGFSPGAAPRYAPAPPPGGGPAPHVAAPQSGGRGKPILIGVGAVVLIGAVAAGVVALGSGGDDPDPVVTPTEVVVDDQTEPYSGFMRLEDDSAAITIDVPEQWTDTDGTAWVVDGQEVGSQIQAAGDLAAFRGTWSVPGVIFGTSETLRASFDPAGLLDALEFDQCTYEGRTDYSDAAYSGMRDEYTNCGNTGASYTVIAAEPATQDTILLVQFQGVGERDEAALDRVLSSFFILNDEADDE